MSFMRKLEKIALIALPVMAMFASVPKAEAGFVCSSSTVHILIDDESSQCAGASDTADSAISFDGNIGFGPSGSAGDASMAIRVGHFSGSAHIGGNMAPGAVPFSAVATGRTSDAITPLGGAPAGTQFTLVIPFHVTGAFNAVTAIPIGEIGYPEPFVANTFEFECRAFTGAAGSACGVALNEQINSTANNLAAPQPVDETWLLNFPIVIGQETDLQMSFFIGASINHGFGSFSCDPFVDVSCHTEADIVSDFLHTGVFEAATILDALGNPVSDVTLHSDSGFDYLDPDAVVGQAPEPMSLALFGFGIASLGLMRLRRGA